MMNQTLSSKVSAFRPACPTQRAPRVARSAGMRIVALGSINDPEKTKAQKEKKEKDSEWAEPHNKNPVEKRTIMRGDPEKEGGENPLKDVAKGVSDAVEGAKDAVSGDKKK